VVGQDLLRQRERTTEALAEAADPFVEGGVHTLDEFDGGLRSDGHGALLWGWAGEWAAWEPPGGVRVSLTRKP